MASLHLSSRLLRLYRQLARGLLLVLLTTLLAPSFAGELVGVQIPEQVADHAHEDCQDCPGVSEQPAHTAGHGEHSPAHPQSHAASADASLSPPCHDTLPDMEHHHCCPGHVLGHLASVPSSVLPLCAASAAGLVPDRSPCRFSSRVIAGLERPPRTVA